LLSVELAAVSPAYQARGLGTLVLREAIELENVQGAGATTYNPGLLRMLHKVFHIVSPDMLASDPQHYAKSHKLVQHVSERYAEYRGVHPQSVAVAVAKRRR
jgi:hypothetical protein